MSTPSSVARTGSRPGSKSPSPSKTTLPPPRAISLGEQGSFPTIAINIPPVSPQSSGYSTGPLHAVGRNTNLANAALLSSARVTSLVQSQVGASSSDPLPSSSSTTGIGKEGNTSPSQLAPLSRSFASKERSPNQHEDENESIDNNSSIHSRLNRAVAQIDLDQNSSMDFLQDSIKGQIVGERRGRPGSLGSGTGSQDDGCETPPDSSTFLGAGFCPTVFGLGGSLGGCGVLSQYESALHQFVEKLEPEKRAKFDNMTQLFSGSEDEFKVHFIQSVLLKMSHTQLGRINAFLKPMLQRDFISALPACGMEWLAVKILSELDARTLCRAEMVCREWHRVIVDGNIWRRIIERKVDTDSLWAGLARKRPWGKWLKSREPMRDKQIPFFKYLYFSILQDISRLEDAWRQGQPERMRLQCRSDISKGVYCLQYDDHKIISGQRDNTIRIWRRPSLECLKVLTGHTGSVLCLQYNERYIFTGSSDSTVRVWDLETGAQLHQMAHHQEAVLHLRFLDKVLVTCSKDRSIAVWDLHGPTEINLRRSLIGHRAAVNVVDLDRRYIVSASGDRTIKIWDTNTCEYVRTLNGHRRGIACLQYRDPYVVSGSSDNSIRIWDVNTGNNLRTLEGHEELVRCLRFDSRRIVSGAYDGKIKIWDFKAAIDPRSPPSSLCLHTMSEHTGRVFRLQFDEFQIISSSHDDTIVLWNFLKLEENASQLNRMIHAAAFDVDPNETIISPPAPEAAVSPPEQVDAQHQNLL